MTVPPLDEVESITQPQSSQHEQQAEDGPFSGAEHQRLRQEYQRMSCIMSHRWHTGLIVIAERVFRLVLHLLQNLINLLKHQSAVCGRQCGPVVEMLKN